METRQLPTSLIIVAVLFIIAGVFSVIEILVSLMNGNININLGVLGLFIGRGLLRLRRGWRTCGLVFLWIALIVAPIIGLLFLIMDGPLDFKVFGQKVGHAPKPLGLVVVAFCFAVSLWQYRVLIRSDVRSLFGLPFYGAAPIDQ